MADNDGWGNPTNKFNKADEWNDGGANTAGNWDGDATINNADSGAVDSANDFGQDGEGATNSHGNGGGCFNCGEEGHMKADCPNPPKPREFTGTCNHCGEIGHRASACPTKPKICRQCHAENDHDTIDCKNKKVIDRTRVEEKSVKEAWAMLRQASEENDIGDFRDAVQVLTKALDGDLTYLHLEKECRKRGFKFYLVALEKEVPQAYTNVDLEGNVGKKYTLGYFTSASCPRPILMPLWPKDAAENLERLEDVGVPMERGVAICGNCDTVGHLRRDCPEEKNVFEGPKVTCALCDEPGHRVRDCTQERRKDRAPRTCKICSSEDHIAKDCDNRPPEICRNCYQEGHRKDDCTNEKVWKCNNCDELGHMSKECKAPKDWSKHKCRHCGEFGHGSENRCDPEKKAAFVAAKAEAEGGNYTNGFGDGADGFDNGTNGYATAADDFNAGVANGDDWTKTDNAATTNNWESAPAASGPVSAGGW